MCIDFATQEITFKWQGRKVTLQQSTQMARNIGVVLDNEQLGKISENACFLVQLAAFEAETTPEAPTTTISTTVQRLIDEFPLVFAPLKGLPLTDPKITSFPS